jgi:putative FmdB family regulatory protein
MPVYLYECDECKHQFEEFKTIAKYDEPLVDPCPSCYKVGYIDRIVYTSGFVAPERLEATGGCRKVPKEFNSLLKNMKKNAGPKSTIGVHE